MLGFAPMSDRPVSGLDDSVPITEPYVWPEECPARRHPLANVSAVFASRPDIVYATAPTRGDESDTLRTRPDRCK